MKTPFSRATPLMLLALAAGWLAAAPAVQAARRVPKARAKVTRGKPRASAQAALGRGMKHLDRQEYSAAIESFHAAVDAQGTAQAYFLLGYSYFQRGFLKGDPQSADRRDALETISAYQMAEAIDPKLSSVRQPHRLYHGLALAFEAVGDPHRALEAYRKAFRAAPENAILPLYAARLRWRMKDAPKATANLTLALKRARMTGQEAALLRMIDTSPLFSAMKADPQMRLALERSGAAAPAESSLAAHGPAQGQGWALRDSVKDTAPGDRAPSLKRNDQAVLDQLQAAHQEYKFRRWREALEAYGDVLRLNEDSGYLGPQQSAMVHERIGSCYNRLGLSGQAAAALHRSLRLMPYNPSAHYQLAQAYAVAGHYRDSLKSLTEAFRSAPSPGKLRLYMLLAKTDSEFEGVRSLPAFQRLIADFRQDLQARRP